MEYLGCSQFFSYFKWWWNGYFMAIFAHIINLFHLYKSLDMLLLDQKYECISLSIHNSNIPPLSFKRKKINSALVMNHPHHHWQLQRFNWKIFAIIRKKGSGNEDLVNEIEIVSVSSFARWLDNSGVMKFFIIFILGLRINFFSREVWLLSFWPDFQISLLSVLPGL